MTYTIQNDTDLIGKRARILSLNEGDAYVYYGQEDKVVGQEVELCANGKVLLDNGNYAFLYPPFEIELL